MRIRGGLTLAAALALAACGNARTTAPPEPQVATTPPPARAAPPVRRPAPAPQPAAPKPVLADLLGRSTSQIDELLGVPDLVRAEGAGEVRIYRNPACVLHVFVYPRNGSRQATHAEARTAAGRLEGPGADECFARFAS